MRRTIWKHRSNPKPPTLVFDRVGFFTRETIITLVALGAALASGIGLGIAVAHAGEDLPHTRHDAEYARYVKLAGGRPAVGDRWADYLANEVRKQAGKCDTISGAWGSADGWSLACNEGRLQYILVPRGGRLVLRLEASNKQ